MIFFVEFEYAIRIMSTDYLAIDICDSKMSVQKLPHMGKKNDVRPERVNTKKLIRTDQERCLLIFVDFYFLKNT
jgi:hypothetical protein